MIAEGFIRAFQYFVILYVRSRSDGIKKVARATFSAR